MRIKSLLGKTANLTFRFVVQNDEPSFGSEKLSFIDGSQEDVIVSKRIILSGDNLIDAKPRMDNQTNETVVSFSLDRVGSKRFGKATSSGVGKQTSNCLRWQSYKCSSRKRCYYWWIRTNNRRFYFSISNRFSFTFEIWCIASTVKYYRRTNRRS